MAGLSETKILDTLLASKKSSTAKVYNNTWKKFRSWCLSKGIFPLKVKAKNILEFLKDGLDKGLSTSTIRRQLAALRSTLGVSTSNTVLRHPHVQCFLKGISQINPPTISSFPFVGLTFGPFRDGWSSF